MKVKMVFKALNGMLPSYMSEKFLRFSTIHSRKTRNSTRNLISPRVKQSYGQRLFMFSAARLWNSLPTNLKDCNSLTSFNKKISEIEICNLLQIFFQVNLHLVIHFSF